jgi:hypothetical protein
MKNFSKFIILFDRAATTQVAFDPDAQLFIDAELAAGVVLTKNQANAINQLVLDLKAASIWSKMHAIYPIVGSTATSHKFNLKDPRNLNVAHRLVFHGGGSHSALGYLPNGINSYADTFLVPSSLYSTNMHLSYYSRTSSIGSVLEIGSSQIIFAGTTYSSLATARNSIFGFTTNGLINYLSLVNSLGFFLGQKLTNSFRKVFRNGVVNNLTVTTDSNAMPNTNVYIGALNDNGIAAFYSSKECAFASIGQGLTDAENLAFYNAVQTYQTTLGRQV